MDSASTMAQVQHMQAGFQILSLLHLTGSLWPQHAHVQDGASFDFIVVGAGTAGSVVANRLSGAGSSVLLIEAGGDPPLESHLPGLMLYLKQSHADWNYTSENDAYTAKCHQQTYFEISGGKMLGGTSSLGYHNYGRGFPKDFDAWVAACKDDNWKWENVEPFYIKSEKVTDNNLLKSKKFHGTEGNIEISLDNRHKEVDSFLQAYKEMKNDILVDVDDSHPLGYAKIPLMISKGARQSTAYCYLKTEKINTNLHVMKNTEVTKIIFDDKKNAIGVEAKNGDKKLTLKATKEVILSAGVFNTPKLLMISGIGPKKDLEKLKIEVKSDLPVGQNLQDAMGVMMAHVTNKTSTQEPLIPTENPAAALVGYVNVNKTSNHPDYLTLHFFVDPDIFLPYCTFALRYNYKVCDEAHKLTIGRKVLLNQIIKPIPKSLGQVKLKSTNPSDQPIIETNYFGNEQDLEDLAEYVKDFSAIDQSNYFRSQDAEMINPVAAGCGDFSHGSKEFWRCYVSCMMMGMSYYSGTCAMGTVVDGTLLVKGVNGLRVADASVMPSGVSSNPSMTVVMIGEKAADIIKTHYKL